jgi:hypothetical protein
MDRLVAALLLVAAFTRREHRVRVLPSPSTQNQSPYEVGAVELVAIGCQADQPEDDQRKRFRSLVTCGSQEGRGALAPA